MSNTGGVRLFREAMQLRTVLDNSGVPSNERWISDGPAPKAVNKCFLEYEPTLKP